jgi:hypothetical protein
MITVGDDLLIQEKYYQHRRRIQKPSVRVVTSRWAGTVGGFLVAARFASFTIKELI